MPLILCPEPTFEGYCKLTAIGQPAMGLFSAEGGSLIGGYGMSTDHRLNTAAGVSSIWDGEPIQRVRAGDGSIVLDGRRLSLHLMAQPDVAAQLLDDELLINQGLLSRILVVFPLSTAGTQFFAEPPLAARTDLKQYEERLAEFVRVPLPLKADTRNELDPKIREKLDQRTAMPDQDPFPKKPKWMQKATYRRLRAKDSELCREYEEGWTRGAMAILGRSYARIKQRST